MVGREGVEGSYGDDEVDCLCGLYAEVFGPVFDSVLALLCAFRELGGEAVKAS